MAIEMIFWFLVSGLIFVPGVAGVFLLVASNDQIILRWQRLRTRYSTNVLKDEDFGNPSNIIVSFRCIGVALLVASLVSGYLSFAPALS